MEAEFETFRGKPIEDSSYYQIICLLIGKRRANRWVKQVTIPLSREPEG